MPDPVNIAPPTLYGTPAVVGNTIGVTTGTWTPTPGSYTYQWQHDSAGNGSYTNISGATDTTYTIPAADLGNDLRCLVTAYAAVTPPPPVSGGPFGLYRTAGKPAPASHQSDYQSMILGWNVTPVSPLPLFYVSPISLKSYSGNPATDYHKGMPLQQARANNWVLQKQGGGDLMNVSYNEPIGDMGLAAYQQAWCANVLQLLHTSPGLGYTGIFMDDVLATFSALTSPGIPVKYPDATILSGGHLSGSWYSAYLSFLTFACNFFHALGIQVYCNATAYPAGGAAYNDATSDLAFYGDLAACGLDGITTEYYGTPSNNPNLVRVLGPAYYQEWDGWQRLPHFCAVNNINFLGNCYITSPTGRDYILASFLLEWNGTNGAFCWEPGGNSVGGDFWNSTFDTVLALGAPTNAIGSNPRTFTGGTVTVNATAGTATIT